MLFVLLGFISLSASFHKGRLGLWLRHPMSVGIAFWSAGHLLANGQKALVYLFGAFFVYSLIDIVFGKPKSYIRNRSTTSSRRSSAFCSMRSSYSDSIPTS